MSRPPPPGRPRTASGIADPLPASRGPSKKICVAQFGAPHGVRGEVRLKAFTADPLAVASYGPLDNEDGALQFRIASLRPAKDMLVARVEGIGDRDAAERLRNLRLYVPRERLPAAEPDEFYHADLIGLAAVGADGVALGSVVAVPNYGAGDLIEIAPAGGGATVLLPFTKAVVPVVDVAAGRVVIDVPAGTFGAGPGEADDEATAEAGQ